MQVKVNLSIGGHSGHRLVLSEEANGELMTKCEQINDLGITVNSAFTYYFEQSLFSPQYVLFWAICPFPVINYIHT